MHPTVVRLSKASRRALTPKRGTKHFYKGTRQAQLPGGHRTGAPGVFTKRGNYKLLDEKVRVFIGPPVDDINNSELRPYVHTGVELTAAQRRDQMYLMPLLPGTKVKLWRQVREEEERNALVELNDEGREASSLADGSGVRVGSQEGGEPESNEDARSHDGVRQKASGVMGWLQSIRR